jgi:hypothetical protein
VQITAAIHVIKIDCGVGVDTDGYTCYNILDVVGDPATNIGNKVKCGMLV